MDAGSECLHPSSQDLGLAGKIGNLHHRYSGGADGGGGAAGGKDLHAAPAEGGGKFDDPRLVGNTE